MMQKQSKTYYQLTKLLVLAIFVVGLSSWSGQPNPFPVVQAISKSAQAIPATLHGQIHLQGSTNHAGVLVTAHNSSQVTTGSDGNFSIMVDSPYVLNVMASGYLSARVEGTFPAHMTSVNLERITLLAGELTGDNKINIFDLALVGTRYGSQDVLTDINRDGVVNILDVALVSSNYGQQGPTLIIINPPTEPMPTPTSPLAQVVTGVVLDPAGEPVANATVTVRGTANEETLTTAGDGSWQTQALPLGVYEFEASAADYDSWSSTRTVDIAQETSVILTLAPRSNAVVGGDFESSTVWNSWDRFDGQIELDPDAFDGQAAALLGTGQGQEVDCWQNNQPGELWTLKQTVTVPNVDRPGLSFVYKLETSQTSFNYAWFEVVIIAGGQPHYLIPWGEVWQATDWQVTALDLSSWRGQTVDLRFQVVHCSAESLTTTLDRVSIGSVAGAAPPPPPTNFDYTATYRQLTACENAGKHHLFIRVVDGNGNGIPNVKVRVFWPGNQVIIETGHKEDPGLVDFPMFKGNYWIEVLNANSQVVGPLTPDIPRDEPCEETGNPVGNSLFHYSYNVTFTKVR